MSGCFVSIITPVYNDGAYLEQCLKSVTGQTHSDFEYIICDNHSKDQSGAIARDYASRDPRIKVVQPPTFLPQGQNFNFALQQISERSRYCKMLFGDDWLFPNCLKELIAVAEANPTVGLVSSYRLIETTPDGFGLRPEQTFFSGREAARAHLLGTAYAFGNPSVVLYRADIVRSRAPHFFDEKLLNFDMDVGFRILEKNDFGFVHQVLSFSRYQQGAITVGISAYNNWFLSRYMEVLDYGPRFLEADEYQRCLAEVTSQFYRGLGEVWLKDRLRLSKREDFGKFQHSQLATTGRAIRKDLLARGIGSAFVEMMAHPGAIANAALKWYERRRT
jgi:glycosyltransferase involved in cell wall biosynthesis